MDHPSSFVAFPLYIDVLLLLQQTMMFFCGCLYHCFNKIIQKNRIIISK